MTEAHAGREVGGEVGEEAGWEVGRYKGRVDREKESLKEGAHSEYLEGVRKAVPTPGSPDTQQVSSTHTVHHSAAIRQTSKCQ